jgi:hypothetical protein
MTKFTPLTAAKLLAEASRGISTLSRSADALLPYTSTALSLLLPPSLLLLPLLVLLLVEPDLLPLLLPLLPPLPLELPAPSLLEVLLPPPLLLPLLALLGNCVSVIDAAGSSTLRSMVDPS